MGKSNCFECFEIVFLRRTVNTTVGSSKQGITSDFSLIGARQDFDNTKLEICFLGHSEK